MLAWYNYSRTVVFAYFLLLLGHDIVYNHGDDDRDDNNNNSNNNNHHNHNHNYNDKSHVDQSGVVTYCNH